MKQFFKVCFIVFILPLLFYEGYFQIKQYQKREHIKAFALAHQTELQAQAKLAEHQVQQVQQVQQIQEVQHVQQVQEDSPKSSKIEALTVDTSKAKINATIVRGDATGIRYVDRGHYWNYPENEQLFAYNEDAEKIDVLTDALGFRNPANAIDLKNPMQESYDILLLGDSFTAAVNTKLDLTLAQHFKNSGLTLYNAGIDGTGTIHQAHILNKVLAKIKPKMVILNFYLGNDFRDNFYCDAIAKAPTASKTKPVQISQTEGQEIQNQEIQKQEMHKQAMHQQVIQKQEMQLKTFIKSMLPHSGVLQLGYNKIYLPLKYKNTNMSYFNRAEMMIMSYRKETAEPETLQAVEKTDQALAYMKQLLAEKGIQFIVVGIPSKAQVLKSVREISNYDEDKKADEFFAKVKNDFDFDRPNELLGTLCKKNEIRYISLLKTFRQNSNQKLYYNFDAHWTYIGQKVAAEYVIPQVKGSL